MQKLNFRSIFKIKKGFTLIEVLCSISVFIILFTAAFSIQLNTFKIKKYNGKIKNYTYVIEYIKNNIIYSLGYEELINLSHDGRKYIKLEDALKAENENSNILSVFSSENPGKEYIEVDVEKGEVLKIDLKLKANIYGEYRDEECEFYKGKFER